MSPVAATVENVSKLWKVILFGLCILFVVSFLLGYVFDIGALYCFLAFAIGLGYSSSCDEFGGCCQR